MALEAVAAAEGVAMTDRRAAVPLAVPSSDVLAMSERSSGRRLCAGRHTRLGGEVECG